LEFAISESGCGRFNSSRISSNLAPLFDIEFEFPHGPFIMLTLSSGDMEYTEKREKGERERERERKRASLETRTIMFSFAHR